MLVEAGSLLVKLAVEYLLPILVDEVTGYAASRAIGHIVQPPTWSTGRETLLLVIPPTTSTVLSDTPGRLRFHLAGLRGNSARKMALVPALTRLPGVRTASASTLTGSVLILYDPNRITPAQILVAAALSPRTSPRLGPSRGEVRTATPLLLAGS